MHEVSIPFLPEFERPMLLGEKTATTRSTRYGFPGDFFTAFGRRFVITVVSQMDLDWIVNHYYKEEGFATPLDFIEVWDRLHPRLKYAKGYARRFYVHRFMLQNKLYQFHVHQVNADGICSICGCDPSPLVP